MVYYKENTSGLKLETKDVIGEILKDYKKGEYTKGRELSKWGSESLSQDREEMWLPDIIAPDGTKFIQLEMTVKKEDGDGERKIPGNDRNIERSILRTLG